MRLNHKNRTRHERRLHNKALNIAAGVNFTHERRRIIGAGAVRKIVSEQYGDRYKGSKVTIIDCDPIVGTATVQSSKRKTPLVVQVKHLAAA